MRHSRLLSLALVLLGGCAQLRFQPPTTSLVAVHVTGISLEGGSLRLLLDVHNPNAYELGLTRMIMGVELEALHFGDVALTEPVRLPGGRTTPLELPVRFTWSGVGAGARALLDRGAVRYALNGTLFADTPIGSREVPVRTSGETSLRELMR